MSSLVVVKIKVEAKDKKWVKAHPTLVNIDAKRNLTAGEIKLAKLIFKDAIDYSKVKIVRGGLFSAPTRTDNAMTPAGDIHLPNGEYDNLSDFSINKEINKVWFIHEMTHVWQYNLGLNIIKNTTKLALDGGYATPEGERRPKGYLFDLYGKDKGKKFNEFNFEQQAEIISYYYDVIYIADQRSGIYTRYKPQILLLQNILKDFLINPKNKNLLPLN